MKVHTTNTVQYFKCLEVHSITNLKYPVSCITYTVLLQIIIIDVCNTLIEFTLHWVCQHQFTCLCFQSHSQKTWQFNSYNTYTKDNNSRMILQLEFIIMCWAMEPQICYDSSRQRQVPVVTFKISEANQVMVIRGT